VLQVVGKEYAQCWVDSWLESKFEDGKVSGQGRSDKEIEGEFAQRNTYAKHL
jgi:ribose 5-phosphate isomerase RpiB